MIFLIWYTEKMEKICRKYKKEIILGAAFVFLAFLLFWIPDHRVVERVSPNVMDRTFSFGLAEGFYAEDIVLELSAHDFSMRNAQIYYTTDGSIPTKEAELYTEPLSFPATDALSVAAIQASVYLDGELAGGPYHATYFLSKNKEAFQNVMLVSITAEREGLFGKENGILYPAVSYVTTGAGERWNQLHSENFAQKGEEWVRTANVTAFEGTGQRLFSQDCGLSVSGNHGSLTHYPFSLKIKADTVYDTEKNVFAADPFRENWTGGLSRNRYDSLAFKNGGNDYAWNGQREDIEGTMLKAVIGMRMARELGLAASPHRIAIVYLNGEFYNLTYLMANVNPKTLAVYTGLDAQGIKTAKSAERGCFDSFGLEGLYISFPDMTDSDIFEERDTFERMVDMRDLFRYYAFELIIGNPDWPQNNFAVWRYEGEEGKDNPYSDGKLRFWVYDTDCMYKTDRGLSDPWEAIFEKTRSENCLLPVLMQIEDYKTAFVNTVLDELNERVFQEDYLAQMIEEENRAFCTWYTWLYGAEAESERAKNLAVFKENTAARRSEVMSYLKKYFEVDKLYTIELLPAESFGSFRLNSIFLKQEGFSGIYSEKYPVTVSYEENAMDAVDYYLVNGKKIKDSVLTITADMAENGRVTIQPVMKG